MKGKLAVWAAAGLIVASPFVAKFIGGWEDGPKPILTVYADKLAGGLPTACNGITKHITDTPVIVGETWTREKCDRETAKAIAKVQAGLAECFAYQPPQSVFDAATSHAWNVGVPSTCGSGAMRAWNAQQWALGCRRLAYSDAGNAVWSYVTVNGKKQFVRGLANRRRAEYAACLRGLE